MYDEKVYYFQKKYFKYAKEYGIRGSALSVVSGQSEFEFVYGYENNKSRKNITTESIFQLGSISKSITALGVIKLVDKGVIDLDASPSKYIGKYGFKGDKWDNITIKQILSHTAGMNEIFFHPVKKVSNISTLELLDTYKKSFFVDDFSFRYTGLGYLVLQCIVEEVMNQKFEVYMKSILQILDMNHSVYSAEIQDKNEQIPYIYMESAATGLYSCVKDMSKFIRHNLNIYLRREIFSNIELDSQLYRRVDRMIPYGLGICIVNFAAHKVFFHVGVNKESYAIYLIEPKREFGFAILTNQLKGINLIYQLVYDYFDDKNQNVTGKQIEKIFMLRRLTGLECIILNYLLG